MALAVVLAACAARSPTPPPAPVVPAHPEFLAPVVPPALRARPGAERVDRGWRYLQAGDLRAAEREFAAALRRAPDLYPAQAGQAYVALARGEHERAADGFGAALRAARDYVPALVGRGLALLGARREPEALEAFEAALALDPSLADLVGQRIQVLRFRSVQAVIEGARAAASAGRLAEARAAYERALAASGDSAFLHRELGTVERRQGNPDAALQHFRRAADLDPGDALSLVQIGQILAERNDFDGAGAAFRRAASIDPSLELERAMAEAEEKAREARLPAEFRGIAASSQITRGELAALIGVRLEPLLRKAPPRQVVITDIRGHWAQPWITAVAAAGIMEPFENHTFQPGSRVRRADLAAAVNRLVALVAATDASLRTRLAERPKIADIAPGHLSYPAVSVAVASGVMPLLDGQRFQVGRAVTGTEAVETIDRVRRLAGI